jgi:hypothetical protein
MHAAMQLWMDGRVLIVTLSHLTDFTGKSINQHREKGKGDHTIIPIEQKRKAIDPIDARLCETTYDKDHVVASSLRRRL